MADKKLVLKAVAEALEASKGKRKFKQTIELAINLTGVDLSVPKNRIDEEIVLPKGRGRTPKVALIGSGELAVKARGHADLIVEPQEIEKLAGDKRRARKVATEMNFFIAEAPLMPTIGKTLGTVLGPRGKMPRPVPSQGDPIPIINGLKNAIRVRSRDRVTFHAPIGTEEMTPEDLADNAVAVLDRVTNRLEHGAQNLGRIYVKASMGPAVKIEVS